MKIIVLVPSKARCALFEKMTGSWLIPSGVDYRVLVEPQDVESYKNIKKLIVLPENNRGLNYSLAQGKKWASAHGYDVVFKLDDDIAGWADSYDKLDPRDNSDRFKLIMKDIPRPLENPNCGGISFGYKQEFWHDKRWFAINQRFQTAYVVKTQAWQPKFYTPGEPNEDMWEDFGNFLRVIDRGYKIIRYGRYLMNTRVGTGKGGLEQFYKNRTPEQYKATIELFRKQFPWLKFRVKENGLVEPDMNNEVIGGKKL